jgi:Tfp pilus assembly protein PilF
VAFLQLRLTLASLLLAGTAAAACSGKGPSSPGSSPERQSEVEYDLARDFFYKGQPRLALEHCRRAVDLNDQNGKALYFTSAIYLSFCATKLELADPDCRLTDAETYVRRALKVDENFREARNTLGQILILEQRYAEAIAVLEPLTRDPSFESSFLAWGNLGWAQVLSGSVARGIESLKNSITEPRFCVGHYRLGVAFEKQGDLAAAELSLTRALAVDAPECRELQAAWAERGQLRLKLGKLTDARGDLLKCRDISSETVAGRGCVEALARLPASTPDPSPPNVPGTKPIPSSMPDPSLRSGMPALQ